MFGRVFATQSFVSAKELKCCMLLLRNIGTNSIELCTLTCDTDGVDADDGYNGFHHVGMVVMTPFLPCPWTRGREDMSQVEMGMPCVAH